MKLTLNNIGKIKTASIEIDGITVIAGENNTGKSTVGRALFAVFNGFYNIESQVYLERCRSIERLLSFFCREARGNFINITRGSIHELAQLIIEQQDVFLKDHLELEREVNNFLSEHGVKNQKSVVKTNDLDIDELIARIVEVLEVPNADMLNLSLGKCLSNEFYGQIVNVFSNRPGIIQLQIKDKTVTLSVNKENSVWAKDFFDFHTQVIYMDDPFVLDDMAMMIDPFYRVGVRESDHRSGLKLKLLGNQSGNLLDEVIVGNKFNKIYDKINSVYSGMVVPNKRYGFSYQKPDSNRSLDVRNLSTGLKTFAIIKQLLSNGSLEQNGTIVLDEPEIHLHPEWQVLFAELIVLIQKEFNMHILLNTHSPYFLRAIEVFAAKHDVLNRCKFYLAEVEKEQSNFFDVTECVDQIYAKLATPLQELEDMRWHDD